MFAILAVLEVLYFCLGGILFIYPSSRRVSESICLGILLSLMFLSVTFQACFLLRIPHLSFLIEALLAYVIARRIKTHYKDLKEIGLKIENFFKKNKIVSLVILICWVYLFLLAIIIPPANWDSMTYNLSRVWLFQQENSILLTDFTTARQSIFVVGSDILTHIFLRFYSDYGVGLFSFLAYVSAGLGTYALSRNFFPFKTSLAATLIVIGMPEFCFQATSTKNDIFTAAAAVFCLVSAYRLLEKLSFTNLGLVIAGILFGASAKTTFLGFLVPFAIIFGYLFVRKYGFIEIFKTFLQNRLYLLLLLVPLFIMSQGWLFAHNAIQFNDLTGSETIKITSSNNPSKLTFLVANLTRYLFQSIHFFPFDAIFGRWIGFKDLYGYLEQIYDAIFKPIFQNIAMGYGQDKPYPFLLKAIPHEDYSWYGIGAILFVIPGILVSIFSKKVFIRATSLTLLSFLIIFSYKLVWTPWNNRYLSLFFVASGVCVAYLLQISVDRLNKHLSSIVIVLSLFILIASCALNSVKPFSGISVKEFFKPNIWLHTNFGRDRLYFARKYYKDNRVEEFNDRVPEGSNVALVAGDTSWIYHFYLGNPTLTIKPIQLESSSKNLAGYDYALCLDIDCEAESLQVPYKILWQSDEQSRKLAKILKIIP